MVNSSVDYLLVYKFDQIPKDFHSFPMINERFNFTSNYKLRVYFFGLLFSGREQSGTDLTNHDQTHCLTEFISKYLFFSKPWTQIDLKT